MRHIVAFCALVLSAACSTSSVPAAPPAACVTEREFRIASTAPGIEIAGSIMTPRGRARAAVLMITGAGPHTREQRISDTPMYTMIAEHLVRRGMVVARTDARDFGASTGPADDEAYDTADRAEDNRAVLTYLRAQPEFRNVPVGLFGHSEGAMIAVMIAANDSGVALNVLLSPSVLPGGEVMGDQFETNLLARGAAPEDAAAVRAQAIRFARFLAGGGERGPEFSAIAHDFLAAHGADPAEYDPGFAEGLIEGYLDSAHYRFFAGYDPARDLARVRQPTIAIFAGEDRNVRSDKHLPAFRAAMESAGNPDFSALLISDQDHFFLVRNGARIDRHVPGEMQLADELYAALDAELARRGWLADVVCAGP